MHQSDILIKDELIELINSIIHGREDGTLKEELENIHDLFQDKWD